MNGSGGSRYAGNLAKWNAQGHRYPEIETAVAKFRDELEASLGSAVTPAQTALSAAAIASYTGVLLIQNRLLAARGRYSKVESLLGSLPTLVGSLQRTMRVLDGQHDGARGDPDAPPRGGLADYLASKANDSEGDGNGKG
jgi:hypothetical protein